MERDYLSRTDRIVAMDTVAGMLLLAAVATGSWLGTGLAISIVKHFRGTPPWVGTREDAHVLSEWELLYPKHHDESLSIDASTR